MGYFQNAPNPLLYNRYRVVSEKRIAQVTKVLTQRSQIEIIQGEADLRPDSSYWAVVTSLPLKPLQVYIEGAETKRELLPALEKSLYVEPADNPADASLCLRICPQQYQILQDERPVAAPLNSPTAAIQALEAIARWRNILNLKSPQRSPIKSQDVELEIKLVGYENQEGDITDNENLDLLASTSELRLEYQEQDGSWQPPVIQIRLRNHSQQKLYANVIDLAEDYSVAVPFFDERSSIVLPGATASGAGIVEGYDDIVLSIPDEFLAQGITEYKDVLKLIVSTRDFNASLLEQDGLEPPNRDTRGVEPQSSLDRLMDRVYSRNAGRSSRRYDDWIAKEIAVTIIKPRDAATLKSDRSTQLLNGSIEVQPHPSLQAQVTLTTEAQTTRDSGNLGVPAALWDDGEAIASWQLTTSRGSDPGLSVLELLNVQDFQSVTNQQPLRVSIARSLAENEYLLPISYDGEFFVPLGFGVGRGDKIEVELERLTPPTHSGRSLGGSIKIFFKKLRQRKLGHSYEYPIIAAAKITEINNQLEVSYQQDREYIKQQVANAQKIVLYIHSIIGDTETLLTSVQQAKVKINGQLRPLQEAYDLVLTFDYESLHTTIEENALLLKERLESIGLVAKHGKELHIVAHSMGGLVARWFIEREGGNKTVQYLVMLGTPNAGSPWSTIQDMSFALLGMGLNQISGIIPPARIITDLFVKSLDFIEQNDNSLDQMRPDSDFIKAMSSTSSAIAASPDPHVPYTMIAGDRSRLEPTNRLRRLANKLFTPAINKVLDELIFGGEPHDLAVSIASIQSVKQERSPRPKILPNVACDHMTYFASEPGLKALTDALER